jgi:hypothetical protein
MLHGTGGGQLVVRLHLNSGETRWRFCKDLEHDTLCRIFGMSPVHAKWDLPKSARGVGTNQSGYGGSGSRWRTIDGYLLWNGVPLGRVMVTWAGEKFRDVEYEELLR